MRAAVFLLFLAAAAEAAAGSAAAPAVATSSAILDNKFGIELLWSYLISTDSFVHYKEVRVKCAIMAYSITKPPARLHAKLNAIRFYRL